MSFRASFTGTCDVIVERAAFEDFAYSSNGGAIYYNHVTGSIMICFSSFKGCQRTGHGGAIYSITGALQLINSCLSYCIASESGQFMLYTRLAASDDAEPDVCCNLTIFFATSANIYTSSNSFKHGIQSDLLYSSDRPFRFHHCNSTQAICSSNSSCGILCGYAACPVVVDFSHFSNCGESYLVMIAAINNSVSEVRSTNFFWNNVSMGIICATIYGYPVRECIFVGNSISREFYGGSTSFPFSISGNFVDDVPGSSGYWMMTDSDNHFDIVGSSYFVSIDACPSATSTPLSAPSWSPTETESPMPTATESPKPTESRSPSGTLVPTGSKSQSATRSWTGRERPTGSRNRSEDGSAGSSPVPRATMTCEQSPGPWTTAPFSPSKPGGVLLSASASAADHPVQQGGDSAGGGLPMVVLIGIVAGVVVACGVAVAICVLLRRGKGKVPGGKADSGSAESPSGAGFDSRDMTTTVAPTTITDPPELLRSSWAASSSRPLDTVFDELNDEAA
jgi:hypothetical protein